MPRSLGFLVLLVSFSLPTAAAIVAGPEVPPVATVLGPTAFAQFSPRIAASADGYLAVWYDFSVLPAGAILATRIASDGTPVDAVPLRITGNQHASHTDVASDGRHYLVVWNESAGVMGRFVEPEGTMSAPFAISQGTGGFYLPRVAWSGSEYLVAWTQNVRGIDEFEAAVIDVNGQITRRVDLGEGRPVSLRVAVAAADGVFHAATVVLKETEQPFRWTAEIGITAVREEGALSRRTVAGTIVVDNASNPVNVQAASGGDDAMFAWSDGVTTSTMRVTSAGFGEVQSFAGALEVLLADGSGYLAVYRDANGRWVRRVGSAVARPLAALPFPADAVSGAKDLIVLSTPPETDVVVQRLDDGAFAPLTVAPRHQSGPDIAAAGSLKLAVWTERIGEQVVIAGARIGPQGTPLDPDGIAIGAAPYESHIPRVAAGPGHWLVVWSQTDRVVGARVAFDGTVLDAEPILIADRIYYPDTIEAAWDGSRWVVVFLNGVPTRLGGSFAVAAVRMTAQGVVEPPMIQASPFGALRAPSIAAGGDGSLVVWTRNDGTVNGSLLSKAGVVTPVAFPFATRLREREIDVAWNGEQWLVAAAEAPDRIVWFFVSATGVVTPAPAPAWLPSTPWISARIDVEPLGDGFLIVYESSPGTISAAAINRDGYVAHGPVTLATLYDTRVAAAGSTVIYAPSIDALRGRITRVVVRQLAVTPSLPKRRAVRR